MQQYVIDRGTGQVVWYLGVCDISFPQIPQTLDGAFLSDHSFLVKNRIDAVQIFGDVKGLNTFLLPESLRQKEVQKSCVYSNQVRVIEGMGRCVEMS